MFKEQTLDSVLIPLFPIRLGSTHDGAFTMSRASLLRREMTPVTLKLRTPIAGLVEGAMTTPVGPTL